jgi:O-antigen ligase
MQLRKDAEAVYSLSKQDIANVEAGYANVEYTRRFSLKKRLYKSLWEYELMKRGAASSGHTLIQRIELWNTAIQIIKAQPLLGVGIGDTQDAFQTQFLINNSSLIGSGLRSHNQFLSTIVGFGILGLVVFLLAILYPVINGKTQKNSLLVYFIVFILTSMLWEDTLETLIGVSIFSFFYSLLVFGTSGLTKKPETD